MKFIRKLLNIIKPFQWRMIAVFGFVLGQQGLGLLSPYLQGKVVDGMNSDQPMLYTLGVVGIIFIVELILKKGISTWRDVFEIKNVDQKFQRYLSSMTLEKVLQLSLAQHVAQNSGIRQNVISRGEHSTVSFIYTMFYDALPMIIEVLLVTVAIFFIGIVFGFVVLLGVIVFVVLMIYQNLQFLPELKKREDLDIASDKIQTEILRNVDLVISNVQEKRAVAEYDTATLKAVSFAESMWKRYVLRSLIPQSVISVTLIMVMALGVIHYYQHLITIGGFVVVIGWSSRALGRVTDVKGIHRRIMTVYPSVWKYFELMDIKPDVNVVDNPIKINNFNGRIEFQNVTLRYPKRSYFEDDEEKERKGFSKNSALRDISFKINSGERVAIVGESGSGKTTLVYTLLRGQDPNKGQILLDGNNLRLIDLKQFRANIGIVPQNVPLFDHSLRYNITYGMNGERENVTDEKLFEISKMACIDRFFHRLENGFDTIIGEKGVRLSGGECQRVGIARALIKNPAVLIFDEATSSLDAENEFLIRKAIEKASKGRTTIIIAHRFSTIQNVDKVIVLDKGRIVGIGKHKGLMRNCAPYRRLVKHQIATI